MTIDIADLAASGISGAQHVCTSQGADTLVLTVDGPVESAALLAPFQEFVLMDGATKRFVGWCDQAPRAASGSAQSHSYILGGPMRWLERTNWKNDVTGGRVMLTRLDDENVLAPLDTTLRAILNEVVGSTSETITFVDTDLDLPILQHDIPPEIRWDSNCADLLRRALSYAPTVSFYWDYSGETPTIRFVDAVKETPDKELSETAYLLSSATINPRYDMLRSSVIIFWLQNDELLATDNAWTDVSDAADLGADRAMICTFGNGSYNMPRLGLGDALLKYHSHLHTDGSATMEELDWSHRPGQLWGFSGILSSGTTSICTQVVRDFFRQSQSLTLGVPPALGIFKLASGTPPPDDPEKRTATITRTILDPDDNAVSGGQYYVGTQIAPSGSSMEIAPGTYTINYIVPPDYVPPAAEGVTLAKGDADSSTVTATYRNRLRLRAADGSGTEEVDINVDDLDDGAGAAKFVLNERCDGKQAWFLQTPWTTPA